MREVEPFVIQNRSFPELMSHAKNWKQEIRSMSTQNFSKIGLLKPENNRLTMYAISTSPGASVQTLFSVAIPLELVEKTREADRKYDLTLKPAFKVDPFIRRFFRQNPPSAEFSLMCERQRAQVVTGVSDYEMRNGRITMLAGDQIFRFNPYSEVVTSVRVGEPPRPKTEPMEVTEIGRKGCSAEAEPTAATASSTGSVSSKTASSEGSANFVSSAKVCPADEKYLAYVLNKQVFVEFDGRIVYHTSSDSKHITNGVPSYIVQEELERFEGIWWSPTHRRLLYEHVNEETVENAYFGINGESPPAPMKYPRAGRPNAVSTLRMVIFENGKVYNVELKEGVLERHCPNYEYITRAGFFSDGTTVWVQVMSRNQTDCSLLLIPQTDFELPRELREATPPSKDLQLSTDLNMGTWHPLSHEETMEKPPRGKLVETVVVHRARSEYWINVHNAIHPLKITNEEQPMYEFIYCLEKPNGSCLALLSAELDENGYCRHTEERLLMAATHSINKSIGLVVDEKRELVYYVANETHPTEWNICVSHYRTGKNAPLTERGICFRIERAHTKLALDPDHGFACWMTSVGSPPQCRFYSFRWTEGEELPKAVFAANISTGNQSPSVHSETPELIEFVSRKTGLVHYALILRPENFDPNKKYPVLHYVYGGPGIQIVHNDYTWIQWIRFARLGYVVVMIDNRGSAHRGIEFERHIAKQMGSVEVEDQVEGLLQLSERSGGFMDMDRVVVHGWSYGGYMALHMIAKHPKIYRAAIAGGAVSDWRLYDTAYTERYMGYPVEEHVYSASSVIGLVDKLPDEPNRLMLIHGLLDENVHVSHLTTLIDACVKSGKWFEPLIFPHERHGIRNNDASIYLDARMMYFAQRALLDTSLSNHNSK